MTTTNYNIDYLDTLHVSKFPGQTSWFRIQANEAIYVDFSIPLNYTLTKKTTVPVVQEYESSSTICMDPNIEYIVEISTDISAGIVLTISNTHALTLFNATTGGPHLFGLCMEVSDLYKLQYVSVLGLRFGLKDVVPNTILDLRAFTNLVELWLGAYDGSIDQILLSDSTLENIVKYNTCEITPSCNFQKLKNCRELYLENAKNLENIEFGMTEFLTMHGLAVLGASTDYFSSALDFFHQNRNKLIYGVYMPNFTYNEKFLKKNLDKILDICEVNRAQGAALRIGSKTITSWDLNNRSITLSNGVTYYYEESEV